MFRQVRRHIIYCLSLKYKIFYNTYYKIQMANVVNWYDKIPNENNKKKLPKNWENHHFIIIL